ncbi:MAG: VOC family protein, partial [Actinobacteria bacterium]|nr:VOC family protein [Actinomycetota bacterium]
MATIELRGVNHIGIRVKDASVSEAFFARLGFEVIARHEEGGVVILKEPGGIEINLIVNGDDPAPKNVLMDVEA